MVSMFGRDRGSGGHGGVEGIGEKAVLVYMVSTFARDRGSGGHEGVEGIGEVRGEKTIRNISLVYGKHIC